MSNISVYMLCSHPDEVIAIEEAKNVFRKDYTELKIQANLLTSFEQNKPITIFDGEKKLIVEYALMLQQLDRAQSEYNLEAQGAEYIVYLPDSEVTKILNKKNLYILPFGKHYGTTKRTRKSYEISI